MSSAKTETNQSSLQKFWNFLENDISKKGILLKIGLSLLVLAIFSLVGYLILIPLNLNTQAVVLNEAGIFTEFQEGDVLCINTDFKNTDLKENTFVITEKDTSKESAVLTLAKIKTTPNQSSDFYNIEYNTTEVDMLDSTIKIDDIYGVVKSTKKDVSSCVGTLRDWIKI